MKNFSDGMVAQAFQDSLRYDFNAIDTHNIRHG